MKTLGILTVALVASAALLAFLRKRRPQKLAAVKPFDRKKYLGKWYEIARMDYRWEEGLDNVTATYSLKENGTIKVDNKGHNFRKDTWEESTGKAKPASDPQEGRLKVSFFGPFYADYTVIAIDPAYRYALVAGRNTDYLWILSRQKTIPASVKEDYLQKAEAAGYRTGDLVWVTHDRDPRHDERFE